MHNSGEEEPGRCIPTLVLPSRRTCLHWACKRNHAQVVSCLLEAGADKQILTAKGELAAELTSKPDIRKILGGSRLKNHLEFLV